jgi:hypothetical protein
MISLSLEDLRRPGVNIYPARCRCRFSIEKE